MSPVDLARGFPELSGRRSPAIRQVAPPGARCALGLGARVPPLPWELRGRLIGARARRAAQINSAPFLLLLPPMRVRFWLRLLAARVTISREWREEAQKKRALLARRAPDNRDGG